MEPVGELEARPVPDVSPGTFVEMSSPAPFARTTVGVPRSVAMRGSPPGPRSSPARGTVPAILTVVVALVACRGGGEAKCVSAVELGGQRFSALGTHSEVSEAKDNSVAGTCIAYCQWGDPTVQAAVDQWRRDNPTSKADRGAVVTVHLANETAACQGRCTATIRGGSATVKTECL